MTKISLNRNTVIRINNFYSNRSSDTRIIIILNSILNFRISKKRYNINDFRFINNAEILAFQKYKNITNSIDSH